MADISAAGGQYLRAGDLINGAEAWAYMILPNGEQKELFMIKNLNATIKLETQDVKTLGHRAKQRKITGWDGNGSMNIYDCTSYFRQLMNTYIHEGTFPYITIVVTNEDPESSTGEQVVQLNKVLLDETSAAAINIENTILDSTVNFTFADYELQKSFADPNIKPENQ